jgi:hypothetical protein
MTRKQQGLTPSEHVALGLTLKRADALLVEAAKTTRCYGRLSEHFYDAANALMSQRSWLERRLIDQVGEDAMVAGKHVRDVYFGMEELEDV